jgi:hypothetical protein
MTPSEKHDQLSRDFVCRVAAETKTAAQMMVVVESMILAAMKILRMLHGMPPSASTGMIEAAVQRAIERFAEQENRR